MHLPYWALPKLFLARVLSFTLPPIYHPSKNRSLLADPRNVDLSSHHYYYFALGLKLTRLTPNPRVTSQLQVVMNERYVEVVEKTQAVGGGVRGGVREGQGLGFLSSPGLRFSEKLESWEREVFAAKLVGLRGLEKWKGEGGRMKVKGKEGLQLERKRSSYGDENMSDNERNKRRR